MYICVSIYKIRLGHVLLNLMALDQSLTRYWGLVLKTRAPPT
jgi:hypothetical protein